jgi:hypothetical protein
MKAYIGDCDDHTLPTYRHSQTDNRHISYPKYLEEPGQLRKNGTWLAYLEYTPNQKKEHNISITVKEKGDYVLRLSDENGQPIKEIELNNLKIGTTNIVLNTSNISNGRKYIELRKDTHLCHFLEWVID